MKKVNLLVAQYLILDKLKLKIKMKIIRNIVASDVQPENKNDIWLDTKTNTLIWGGELIKAAPYSQTVEISKKEIYDFAESNPETDPSLFVGDILNKANVYCPVGGTIDCDLLTEFTYDSNFDDKTLAVKIIGSAETADDFYFDKDISAHWSIAFPALGISLERDRNNSKTIKIVDSEYETIESYTYEDLNSLNAFLSKYGLDKWNIGIISFGSSYLSNNRGVLIQTKIPMPVMYCGNDTWLITDYSVLD